MLFPDKSPMPGVILLEEVKQIHDMILSLRRTLNDMEKEIDLLEEGRKLLPQMLVFFNKINEKLAER